MTLRKRLTSCFDCIENPNCFSLTTGLSGTQSGIEFFNLNLRSDRELSLMLDSFATKVFCSCLTQGHMRFHAISSMEPCGSIRLNSFHFHACLHELNFDYSKFSINKKMPTAKNVTSILSICY